jgi:lipoate-protein ligase A
VAAAFHRKNDLEVAGRKIAGLGLYAAPSGGLLFHASLVVEMDIAFMVRVLRTPFEKLADKAVATVAERMTTVRREAGRPVAMDEARSRIRAGYAEAFGTVLGEEHWSTAERAAIRELEEIKYLSPTWLHQPRLVPDAGGHSRHKAAGGLMEVSLTLRGDLIQQCTLTGDFFAADGQVVLLERVLRRTAAEPAAVRAAVARAYAEGARLEGIPPDLLAAAVLDAAADAAARRAAGQPHGCFVNP